MNETNPSGNPSNHPGIDAELEREINEALGDQSAEELMEQSLQEDAARQQSAAHSDGDDASEGHEDDDRQTIHHDIRRGRISAIRGEDVFVDLVGETGKLQGVVPLTQFDRPPRVGAIMDFVVDRVDEAQGLVFLSREGAVKRATWEQLTRGAAVEARVVSTNKGGLDLEMIGGIRAFMPASQIDLGHVDDIDQFVGQKLEGVVQEIDRRSRRVVLSRRELLQQRRETDRRKLLAELEVGQIREGKVTSILDFGAFVDLGGVDGLVHISDLSYSHIDKPGEVVKVGQSVKVKVLKIDTERDRIGLGLKQVEPDPWEKVEQTIHVGDQIACRVVRLANFGAFVEVIDGVEGLLPISEMSWKRIGKVEDVASEGQVLHLKVIALDVKKNRITLSLKQAQGDPWIGAEHKFPRNSLVDGKVIGTTTFGAFVELDAGVEGLVHISELAGHRVKSVDEVLKVGDVKQFRVMEISEEDRKIKLSLKAASEPDDLVQQEAAGSGADASRSQGKTARKPKPKNLKPGIGSKDKDYGMGMGLGDLKL